MSRSNACIAAPIAVFLALASVLAAGASAASVGVARFSGADGEIASARLSTALTRGRLARVVPPDGMREGWAPEPEARQVRDMARLASVDHVVVGRGQSVVEGTRLDVELRSGHSGAVLERYRATAQGSTELEAATQVIAASMLDDLDAAPELEELPEVSATGEPRKGGGGGGKGEEEEEADPLGLGLGNGDKPVRIRSDELEVIENDDGRRIVFTDNVVVTQGDIRIVTDVLEAFYPPDSNRPDRLVATGHVRVNQRGRKARCEKAVYTSKDETVVCSGRAELHEGCDRVRGDEIHFNLTTERVRVLGAPSVVIHPESSEGAEGSENVCGAKPS